MYIYIYIYVCGRTTLEERPSPEIAEESECVAASPSLGSASSEGMKGLDKVLKRRNRSPKGPLCPVVLCPYLCSSDGQMLRRLSVRPREGGQIRQRRLRQRHAQTYVWLAPEDRSGVAGVRRTVCPQHVPLAKYSATTEPRARYLSGDQG